MALSSFPDIFSWIGTASPIPINLCLPSLKLSMNNSNASYFTLSIAAHYNIPIPLWTSKKIPSSLNQRTKAIITLLDNTIQDVIKYTPNKCPYSLKLNQTHQDNNNLIKDMFNFSFLALTFIICVYEAPTEVRGACLNTLKDDLLCPKAMSVFKALMRFLGSNVEELWMRSMNLAITNWISELDQATIKIPSPLFCYSLSTVGLWKVQVYCPIIAMDVEKSSGPSPDDRLLFSLNYQQLESVIQLNYSVDVQDKWMEVMVTTDNIRCDVMKLATEVQMRERGAGSLEKHFPSRIGVQLTPCPENRVISVSVSKSTQNVQREIGVEKGIEASFEPPTSIGIHFSAGESVTTTLQPWKFEQSVYGNTANLNWYLHDSEDGREVFSSKPSKLALIMPKSWFKNRYSSAQRPFTRQGGVVFAGDQYGERVSWKVDTCQGKSMEWEMKGWIWLTYWPNKRNTFYTETRKLEFKQILHLNLP